MQKKVSEERPGYIARFLSMAVFLILILGLTATIAPAQELPTEENIPTDAEMREKLEPVILSETRKGDVTTITIEIPAAADTFTTSGQPNTNWGNNPNLRVGFNQTLGLGAQRIYLFFNMNSIPSNATIQSATLRAFINGFSPNGDAPMGLLARFLSTPFDASTITWNNYNPSWGLEIGVGQVPASVGWIEASFTGPVSEWVAGTRPNNGILIQGDETIQQRERIFTAINANNNLFPRLVVTYQVIVDTTPPTSTVTALPTWSPATFNVNWSGADNAGGSGIKNYDVQFRANNGAWQSWQTATINTSASFTGQNGVRYDFRVRAIDIAGNVEAWSNTPDTGTTVDTMPPSASVNPLPQYTFANTFVVSWAGTDTGSGPNGGSGIARFDVEFRLNNGPWTPFATNTTTTSGTVLNALEGQVYAFRARAVDNVGNVQPLPAGAQAETTISLGSPIAHIVPFNPPISTINNFLVQWAGQAPPGATIVGYDVQFRFNGGSWQNWLSNVNVTSQQFSAASGDGVYEFQVRVRDSVGRVSAFTGGPGNSIAVDAVAPFITIRYFNPVAASD